MKTASITRANISAAKTRFAREHASFIRETPLMKLPGAALGIACKEVWLKLEHCQVSGSFKARGMLNRLISNPIPKSGVIVASGGNAGIATAAAAKRLGVTCEVFLPEVSSQAKRNALAALGAKVVVQGAQYADALAACLQRQSETGALLTHAYDQIEGVTGAGTIGCEVDAQAGDAPDTVLVSVGGGGLIAGIASWYAGTDAGKRTRVIALEPTLAPTLHAARAAGAPVDVSVSGIAADALGAKRVGNIAWSVFQSGAIEDCVLLDDDTIKTAQRYLWKELHLAVEPSAALGLAAMQCGAYVPRADETVCVIVCGANVDVSTLTR
jgi:threonine dehydratase